MLVTTGRWVIDLKVSGVTNCWGGLRHNYVDVRAQLGQLAGKINSLVAGYRSADGEYDVDAGKVLGHGSASVPVHVKHNPETRQSEIGVHGVEYAGLRGNDVGEAASRDHMGVLAELILEPPNHSLHKFRVAQHQSGLDRVDGVLAYGGWRRRQLHPPEHGSRVEERICSYRDSGSNRTSQVISLVVDSVEDCGGAYVYDNHRSAKHLEGSGSINHAVCANVAGRIVSDPDTSPSS